VTIHHDRDMRVFAAMGEAMELFTRRVSDIDPVIVREQLTGYPDFTHAYEEYLSDEQVEIGNESMRRIENDADREALTPEVAEKMTLLINANPLMSYDEAKRQAMA
jgi:hypothetical protein